MPLPFRSRLLSPSGLASLRQFLQAERPTLMQAPILVIASEPPSHGTGTTITDHHNVSQACQHVNFTLAQQMGFRTVSSTISSAYPTKDDLGRRIDLLRRTGASSIVAVGSGASIDLAKALQVYAMDNENLSLERIILIPSTSAALLASTSSHALVLDDSTEEALVPIPSTNYGQDSGSINITVAPLESQLLAQTDSSHLYYASLALALDASYREGTDNNSQAHDLLTDLAAQIGDNPKGDAIPHDVALDLLFRAGSIISYGLPGGLYNERSAPLALAVSLIPRIFPHVHILTFLASLVPGLARAWKENGKAKNQVPNLDELVDRILTNPPKDIPQLTVSEEYAGFSIPDMSLSHIQSNQSVWNCLDLPDEILIQILHDSVKR